MWTVEMVEELSCFQESHASGWFHQGDLWGLYLDSNNEPQYIGTVIPHHERSKVAKFTDDNRTGLWHGFPANCSRDKIPFSVLEKWQNLKLISKSTMGRLMRGQLCSL